FCIQYMREDQQSDESHGADDDSDSDNRRLPKKRKMFKGKSADQEQDKSAYRHCTPPRQLP
ncbi:hypothetical protein HK097_003506, partial [Rhizophlyctis rosea]